MNRAVIAILACAALLTTGAAGAAEKSFHLRAAAGPAGYVNANKVQGWADVSTVVATGMDQTFDTTCDLSFDVVGDVVKDPQIVSDLSLPHDYNYILSLPKTDLVVVSSMKYCAGTTYAVPIAGCKSSPGTTPIILVNAYVPGLSLIHEIGHKAGRGHTYPSNKCPGTGVKPQEVTDADFYNIMYCEAHTKRKVMTATDCTKFRSLHFGAVAAVPASGSPVADDDETPVEPSTPIQSMLLFGFGEDDPEAMIEALTDEQVGEVREAFYGPVPDYWASAAVVLALRGDREDAHALPGLAERAAKIETAAGFRARTSVPDAIGIALERQGADKDTGLAAFLVEHVAREPAGAIATPEDVGLVARAYLRGAALTGDGFIAQSAIDVAATEAGRTADSDFRNALSDETLNEIADLALRVQDMGRKDAMKNWTATRSDARTLLLDRSRAVQVIEAIVDVLNRLNVRSSIVT